MPEVVRVAGVSNFRGLGGIKVGEKHFKKGLAFRCGSLHKITAKGVETLQKLNICVDIDLRTANEKLQKPDPEIEGIELFECDLLGRPGTGMSHEKEKKSLKKKIAWLKTAMPMEELYAHMLIDRVDNIKRLFDKCVDCLLSGKPFLFHCSVGKDRTGITAFLLLGVLGADKKDIVDDYMLTRKYKNRKEHLKESLIKLIDYKAGKVAVSMMVVRRSYIESAFKTIEEEGGFLSYAKNRLGVDEATISRLKDVCLE